MSFRFFHPILWLPLLACLALINSSLQAQPQDEQVDPPADETAAADPPADDETPVIPPITQTPQMLITDEALDLAARERLAVIWSSNVIDLCETDPLTLDTLDAALQLLESTLELDPDSLDHWRLMRDLANIINDRDLFARAIDRITQLDPTNDRAQLARLNIELEQYQTVEQRMKAMSDMLVRTDPSLPATIASRIAFDLALLARRHGDPEEFARWLGESIALDASNRAAMSLATGYFRSRVGDDPFAEAELLTMLYLADPSDMIACEELAAHTLANGAPIAAERLYRQIAKGRQAVQSPLTNELLADYATALWANGKIEQARNVIRKRQLEVNAMAAEIMFRNNPDLSIDERDRVIGPISSTLATVRAAIVQRHDPDGLDAAVQQTIGAYQSEVENLRNDAESQGTAVKPAQVARRFLELAFVVLWLHADADQAISFAEEFIGIAADIIPITEAAQQRFDGWIALRRNDYAHAIDLLSSLPEDDAHAQMGRAICQRNMGSVKDAARTLLKIARSDPGTVIGVWCTEELYEILGRRAPLSADAQRIDELIRTIPPSMDLFAETASMAVSLSVTPRAQRFGVHDPVLVDIELRNRSEVPFAIDPDGPIRPQLAMEFTMGVAGESADLDGISPAIIELDQRLRLEPNESLKITVNLRELSPAAPWRVYLISGSFMRIKVTSNFFVSGNSVIHPGMFGQAVKCPPFRVEGVRGGRVWAAHTLEMLKSDAPLNLEMVHRIIELSHMRQVLGGVPDEELQTFFAEGIDAAVERFHEATPAVQAMITMLTAKNDLEDPYVIASRAVDNQLVKVASVLTTVRLLDDPFIAQCKEDDAQLVRTMGSYVEFIIDARLKQLEAERAAQRSNR